MKETGQKLYVIKKFVMASSVRQALMREKTTPVDSVWIDDEWAKGNGKTLADAVGFSTIEPSPNA